MGFHPSWNLQMSKAMTATIKEPASQMLGGIQEEYINQGSPFIDKETKTLNRVGITVLSDLYENSKLQNFKEEILDFIRDKTELVLIRF